MEKFSDGNESMTFRTPLFLLLDLLRSPLGSVKVFRRK